MIGRLRRRRVVGLALGGAASAAVLAGRGRRGGDAKPLKVAEGLPVRFQAAAPDDLDDVVKALAHKLGGDARRADTPTAIALPDPLFREDRFAFAEVPDKPSALDDLIKWRIAREHRLEATDLAIAHQRIAGDGEAAFLVRFAQKPIIDAVEAAARRAGLTPVLIEAQSRFLAASDPVTAPMAAVALRGDWWTLIYRDLATPEGHVRSEWRMGEGGDMATLAAALTRLIRTMARAEAGLTVTVSAETTEQSMLIDALGKRLGDAVAILAAPGLDDRGMAIRAAAA